MRLSSASPKPLTGQKVLAMLIAFFAVVIGVNVTMMKLALLTLPGTDVDSAYTASFGYEKEIMAAHDQDERLSKVDADVRRATDSGATLKVEARNDSTKPLTRLK